MTGQAPIDGLASPTSVITRSSRALRPPKRLKLSEWADEHFYLSAESAAEPGRWRTIPYQRGIMDAITDPTVERVSVMKSARVGWTKILDATIGFYMHQDPCPILAAQPTVEDAEGFSKEEIAPMLRDCPALRSIVPDAGPRGGTNTILHKKFPGGVLSMVGANSPRGFRRTSRKIIALDEVDGFPQSAGNEGDPISLAIRRSEYYWDRKILIGSTPTIAGVSRIAEEFHKGDQRRYHVPCPQCGHLDFLTFREQPQDADAVPRGHYMKWPEGRPQDAFFVCRKNGCVIEHKAKRWMIERGQWVAEAPFNGHASFAIWAAYSYSPNASWGQLAAEFLEANAGGVEKLKTFVNTALGEVWIEKGESPEWQRLYQRREHYPIATVPRGVVLITAGVDVQKDRLPWEVVGWSADRQSWTIDAGIIPGDTATEAPWAELRELLDRAWPGEDGLEYRVRMMAVDSGFNTQTVYDWARQFPGRVLACKGVSTAKTLIGAPTAVDVNVRGKRIARGVKVWPVGVDIVKGEFYGWLRLNPPTSESGAPFPPGYCHHPELGEEYFKQITAEHLITVQKRNGFVSREWCVIPGRENHWLDCRVYARAAAAVAGLDRLAAGRARPAPPPRAPTSDTAAEAAVPPAEEAPRPDAPARPAPQGGGWLGGRGRLGIGRGSWLRR